MLNIPLYGRTYRLDLCSALLITLVAALWLAGGASRADAPGQIVVRSVCWALLIMHVLLAKDIRPPRLNVVGIILAAATALALLQQVPLPPAIWLALPGRETIAAAATASGQPQPWRPLTIAPGATLNAASSLIVPIVAYVLIRKGRESMRYMLVGLLLAFITGSLLVGLMQASGASIDNPFINDSAGQVSGMFANRNHFALFLAIGCLLTPTWVFSAGRRASWRGPAGVALLLLLLVTILATGSRAGLLLGLGGFAIGLALARQGVLREFRGYPRWVGFSFLAGVVGIIAIFVLITIAADRAASINRLLTVDTGQDMRSRGLLTVIEMIRTYFPAGSGLGSFDAVFRMHEPMSLLKFTYFNHAHNDFLEIALDTGILGALLLAASCFWWAVASWRVWRSNDPRGAALPRCGSAILLLILVASIFDYPARTPMIMVLIIIGATWLSDGAERERDPALPMSRRDL